MRSMLILSAMLLGSASARIATEGSSDHVEPMDTELYVPKEFCAEAEELSASRDWISKDGKLPYCTLRPCDDGPHVTVPVADKHVSFFPYCRVTWDEAQAHCRSHGGRLWEPTSAAEFDAVFSAIGYNPAPYPGVPSWFNKFIHYWIGFKNIDGIGSSARHASNPGLTAYRTLYEHGGSQDCVDIFRFESLEWGDHHCDRKLPFICETIRCGCNYNGASYKCGSMIAAFPNCCMKLYCDKKGNIKVIQEVDSAGNKLEKDCCKDGNNGLLQPGDSITVANRRKVCCKGELIDIVFKSVSPVAVGDDFVAVKGI